MTTARRATTVLLTLMMLLLLLPVSPASAEVVRLGYKCEGARAVRCAWVNHDTTNNRVRGYGSVQDTTSGRDAVAALVELYRWSSVGWVNVSTSPAWQHGYDSVQNNTYLDTCLNGDSYIARIKWKWNGTDSGYMDSLVVNVPYC